MANPSIGYVVNKVRKLPGYEEQFQKTFGEGISVTTIGKAIASYERTLLSATRLLTAGISAKIRTP